MDGRDIGTVVLPGADMKVFLTAQTEDRAERRYLELLERGQEADRAQVLADILERDRRDTEREAAPLRQAEDAVVIDTTGKDLQESATALRELIRSRLSI
jgi:cytidylate kinase